MTVTDWTLPAKLIERDDSGSELDYNFHERAAGSLADLIGKVASMDAIARARMLIDAGPMGMLNVSQVLDLARRDDFPA